MKARGTVRVGCNLVAAVLVFICFAAFGEPRQIRLRNEIITTVPAAQARPASPRDQSPATGLYLVQFNDHLDPAWQVQLHALGVELLRYVPDDAFIARFENVSPASVRALEFVRWVGPYRAEYKVHGGLKAQTAAAARGKLSPDAIAVSVLVSPRATPQELDQVRPMLSVLHHESRLKQGTVLRGTIPPGRINALAQSTAVLWIEPAPKFKLSDEVSSKIVGGDDGNYGTFTTTQQLGYTGAGVTVAVADTGLNNGDAATMHPDLFGRVTAFLHYGDNNPDAADEHSHGTHVAGIVAADAATGETDDYGSFYGLGVAPGASLVVQRIFDGTGNYADPPPSNEHLTRDAVQAGAKIGSNSWGDDVQGRYDISAAEFDELVRDADSVTPGDQPYILEFSAGNAGPDFQTMDSPATAKNVIATGASENDRPDYLLYADGIDTVADFSSRGPCEDGRIKPDVVAPGTWIASLQSASATDENAWLPIDDYYQFQGGTSQAGPHASGAAAVFVQYYQAFHDNALPSPALVKAALINSAVDMDDLEGGTAPIPNADEGWGRIDLSNMIGSSRMFEFVDQTNLLTTGQTFEHHAFVKSSGEPFKVTLVYTDVPGFPGAIPALVNDLDLEVVGPDGAIYRGNQFESAESVRNAPSSDSLNNVEAVILSQPAPGDYLVRIRARNVSQDARIDTPAVDQDFALVISGDFPQPGQGLVLLDHGAYKAPGSIKVTVVDSDLAGSASVSAHVWSTTEPAGENFTLPASGGAGVFTSSIPTLQGSAATDGKIEIHHGDQIHVEYFDASAGVTRSAIAVADFVPPVLTSVAANNGIGQTIVTWQTDEPSDSVVRYSTNLSLTLSATNSLFTTSHSVALGNLRPGTTYHFAVSSTDDAGNSATNDNAGALYSFITPTNATVLLVDAYVGDSDSEFISVGEYTNALAAAGISCNVWDVSTLGTPSLAVLQAFPAVFWRVSDSFYSTSQLGTLSPAQQTLIQNYLDSGGSFFMSSMEILSRVGDVPFRRNVFQVDSFLVNQDPFSICDDCDEDVGVPSILGVGNDPITAGMDMELNYDAYPSFDLFGIGPDLSDTFTPTTNAAPIIFSPSTGGVAGMRYPRTGVDSPGRVVFLSFPIDTVPNSGAVPNNRVNLLRNIVSFLVPGVNGLGNVSLDNTSYGVPGLVTVEVGDTDLAGSGQAQATFSSTAGTNRVTITLNETTRPGLFRGYITLVATNPPPGAAQLRAFDGNTITAEYFDASANSVVLATATVDTQAPVVSDVEVSPGYQNAIVSWGTSEAGDSLVQFGESPLLNRTAFDPHFNMEHSITLTGLTADRIYYFQVVSRDGAGNTVVDDNNGQLYTFHTLTPLHAPWFDDLETGATNWIVQDVEDSETGWTLGVPNNSLATEAHSPTHAWGSNLQGQNISQAESFLISPAIDLSGGVNPVLTFWHSYDFTEFSDLDIIEYGELMVITNELSDPISLKEYDDYTDGWVQESYNLSPYAGNVVYLVWHYIYFSLDSNPHPGWLVDDVGIHFESPTTGTLVISNNLAQGQFTLTGPLNQAGQGRLTILSNAPPGQYAIQFGNVPFYQTPSAQTNTLNAGTTLVFNGVYTFTDANNNGISDAWELQYFGTVSGTRTQLTDTDGDKMTDYAEFIAGTDPTNAASKLAFTATSVLPDGLVQMQWSSVPGRVYRVESSVNASAWMPVTDWLTASGGTMTHTVTNLNTSLLFRVQVQP